MIRFYSHREIDKTRWDRCIESSANKLIYGFSWYLDVLCQGKWDALIEDDYHAVFPLPRRKKGGFSYIYTPFFVQQLGAFSSEAIDEKSINLFLSAIPKEFRLVELNLNIDNRSSNKNFKFINNANHEVSLNCSYETLQSQYSENLRRNLRKAQEQNVSIRTEKSAESIIRLFREGRGKNIKHWSEKEYETFRELLRICEQRNHLEILGAYFPGDIFIAGAVFLRTTDRAIFIFSATGDDAKTSGAMAFLIDKFIKENAGKNLILDFEGSNDPGLARFYASFGSYTKTYQRAVRNTLPKYINFLRRHLT